MRKGIKLDLYCKVAEMRRQSAVPAEMQGRSQRSYGGEFRLKYRSTKAKAVNDKESKSLSVKK